MEKRPRFMIHACIPREWYVRDYLIPSMVEQGIKEEDIEVWLDRNNDGCLLSAMKAFHECGKRDGGTWHMQDDVVISSDFAEKTREYDDGVVCGYMYRGFELMEPRPGRVPAVFSWNSFPCIRIPNKLAGEFADWFFTDAIYRDNYKEWVDSNKHDDSFWHDFYDECHNDDYAFNLKPSIVDHIDYMLGGSVVNQWRGYRARATFWEDEKVVEELQIKLARR